MPPSLHAAFEEIGAGARPIAMGSAFTAISDDPHAIHYNPAGLAQIRRGELTAGYGRLYLGLKDKSNIGSGFVGIAQSLQQGKYGTIAAGWTSLALIECELVTKHRWLTAVDVTVALTYTKLLPGSTASCPELLRQ